MGHGLRHVSQLQDVQELRPITVRDGQVIKVEALNPPVHDRRVNADARHRAFCAQPQFAPRASRYLLESHDASQCVPESHPVESLPEQCEPAAVLSLLESSLIPGRWADAPRAEICHRPAMRPQHLLCCVPSIRIGFGLNFFFEEFGEAVTGQREELGPAVFVKNIQHGQFDVRRRQVG